MSAGFCLKEFTPVELEHWVQQAGHPSYRARQVLKWMYGRQATGFEEMTDLSKGFRSWLAANARLSCLRCLEIRDDEDGTRKLLYGLEDGAQIEGVLIGPGPRLTLCVSSQVGCALGCKFCLTGRHGLRRNLSAGEIVDQVCAVRRELGPEERLTNLVFMGMGEPLANYNQVVKALHILISDKALNFSPRRITLSTVGLIPEMERLCREMPVKLAISLHASDERTRSFLMPINRRYPLPQLLEACRRLPLPHRQRLTVEYLLLDGVNDSEAAARRLSALLRGMRAKINLIPFNEYPGCHFRQPRPARVEAFREVLRREHFTVTVRQSRGVGIMAACGQLGGRAAPLDKARPVY